MIVREPRKEQSQGELKGRESKDLRKSICGDQKSVLWEAKLVVHPNDLWSSLKELSQENIFLLLFSRPERASDRSISCVPENPLAGHGQRIRGGKSGEEKKT